MLLKNRLNIREARKFGRVKLLKKIQTLFDLGVLALAFTAAYLLRFDFSLETDDATRLSIQILFVVPLQLSVLYLFGVHKFIWRYISLRETKRILTALLVAATPLFVLRLLLPTEFNLVIVPFSIIVLNFCLAAVGILAIRIIRREIYENRQRTQTVSSAAESDKKAILLVGAGRAGVKTLAEIKGRGDINLNVKGFVDDDEHKHGAVINGVKVYGGTDSLPQLVKQLEIDHIIISIAQAAREDFRRILDVCQSIPIKVRTIPGLYELLQEKVSVSRIRDIEIEDLLGRSPIQLDQDSINAFLKNKTVMITGAGGSIGSELVRQLAQCQPEKLVLVERTEFALFQIESEIRETHPHLDFAAVIGDVCDAERMTKIFQRFVPQVIFHAAAHKHVPMMEANASEALKNNVLGTNSVARLAGRFGVESFVLISTDKAVNPTSIMGATKRLSELIVQNFNEQFDTRFVAVRFGNVIGSNGSVIPTFREQIKKGGPVTVTHPEMERFFMTIPEATQLVLQAGALGKGGEIFILDMGKPMRILDLARETVRLSGLRPDVDIQIVFTGIRHGEKLFEELGLDKEQLSKTIHPKIYIGRINSYPGAEIARMLDAVREFCLTENDADIRRFLSEFLPESKIQCQPESVSKKYEPPRKLSKSKAQEAVAVSS